MSAPAATPATDDPRRARLRRMKLGALALLALMLAGFALSHAMGLRGGWAWLGAFCEAAAVGALADWFAVVALFRRPLGLPIPHTAVIARGKDRLGEALAVFVRDHFLAPQALLDKLQVFDPAGRLGQWLARPEQAHRLADLARQWAQQALALLDAAAIRSAIHGFVIERLRAWNAAASAGEVLALLTADGRHQDLLDAGLQRIARWLAAPAVKAQASALIVRYARREWPRIVGTVDYIKPIEEIGDRLAERIAAAALEELQTVLSTPDHPLRRDYEAWLQGYIARLRDDPALHAQVAALKQQAIEHPALQDYVGDLWERVRAALGRDLASPDSRLALHLEHALVAFAGSLQRDEGVRNALNEHLLEAAASLTGRLRGGVTEHIAQTVKGWDERTLVQTLELSVGPDLQYIRYNGTVVGGLIGLLLHAATAWMG
ncbi:MAG: DUF445 family protein [Pseudoxanthomonas sp.]